MQLSKDIIDRFTSGRCTDAELDRVAEWLQDGEADGYPEVPGDRDAIWRKIEAGRRPVRYLFFRRLSVAAAAVLLAGTAVYGLRLMLQPRDMTVRAAVGQSLRTVLPDSSVVFLEGPSTLRFPAGLQTASASCT